MGKKEINKTKLKSDQIEKTLKKGVLDLWSRDLEELIMAKRYKEALSVGKYLGMPEEEINKIIQGFKNEKERYEENK